MAVDIIEKSEKYQRILFKLKKLAARTNFSKDFSLKENEDAWMPDLMKHPYGSLDAAFKHAENECENFPSFAEFSRYIIAPVDYKALTQKQYDNVMSAVRRYGMTHWNKMMSEYGDDEIFNMVVQKLGGWSVICEREETRTQRAFMFIAKEIQEILSKKDKENYIKKVTGGSRKELTSNGHLLDKTE